MTLGLQMLACLAVFVVLIVFVAWLLVEGFFWALGS